MSLIQIIEKEIEGITEAIEKRIEKQNFLLNEEAITANAREKFQHKEDINNIKEEISNLKVELTKLEIQKQEAENPSTIKYNKSENQEDDSAHLLDKIYWLLKKFDGLSYINPDIIANAKPFNNSNDYVWHYSNFNLESAEEGIYDFFKEIKVSPQKIIISESLKEEFENENVTNFQEKIEFIIRRMNDCFIFSISCYKDLNKVKEYLNRDNVIGGSLRGHLHDYNNQLHNFSIDFRNSNETPSNDLTRLYEELKLNQVIKILKSREGTDAHNTFESGYYHYIFGTDNFKKSYLIFKNIAEQEKEKDKIRYFLAQVNLLSLHNLIEGHYDLEDKKEIMQHIKSIDLDTILHNLNITDSDLRNVFIEIKENLVRQKINNKVENVISDIEEEKHFWTHKKGRRENYYYPHLLLQQLVKLVAYYEHNYILGNIFTDYRKLCKKIASGYLMSYSIPEKSKTKFKCFESYHLDLLIFNLFPSELEELFEKYEIKHLNVSKQAKQKLVEKITNFLKSNHNEKWAVTQDENIRQALSNFHFQQTYRYLFSNLFFVLSKIDLKKPDCEYLIPSVVHFFEFANFFYHSEIKVFFQFTSKYPHFIPPNQLIKLLEIFLKKENFHNDEFMYSLCNAIKDVHPNYKLSDEILTDKMILRAKESYYTCRIYQYLTPYWKICDRDNQKIIENQFYYWLDNNFTERFYRSLLINKIIDINTKDYFREYLRDVNSHKGSGDLTFKNFIFMLYKLDIDTKDIRITNELSNLQDKQEWLLNLKDFDYSKFDTEWLLEFDNEIYLQRFSKIRSIKYALTESLKKEYNAKLAEIYVKYFLD